MNFEYKPLLEPLKVYFVNPLAPASQLAIVKIMSGLVFENDQSIDMTLVVYSNEMKAADAFRLEIESCAFSCTNSIKVSSDLPCVSDADVFCFITNFNNPNYFGLDSPDEEYDAIYLAIKLAHSLKWSDDNGKDMETMKKDLKEGEGKIKTVGNKKPNPVFMTDGLVATDIIKTLSTNVPNNIFFYPTPLTAIAKSVLSDYLDMPCKAVNEIFVWAANDKAFHIEVQKPLIIYDRVDLKSKCEWNAVGKDLLKSFKLDSTQLSASWMKKDFIEKVASSASKNPYGCIYKAVEFTNTLRDIWRTRIQSGDKVCRNIGCISDGSLGTIKGYPYVLPIVFQNGIWTVNDIFQEDTHLKQEIKRMNKTIKEYHDKLILYSKKFLQGRILYQSSAEDNSGSTF